MSYREEPLLNKLHRLDNIIKQLEGMRGGSKSCDRSSGESTPTTTTTTTSDDHSSSVVDHHHVSELESMEKYCRPMYDVFLETKVKGSLIERITHVEEQLLKMEAELQDKEETVGCGGGGRRKKEKKKKKNGGLKGLVQSVMKVGH